MLTSMLLGLMSASSGAYAQETAQKSRHGAEPVAQKPTGIADYEKLLDEADALIKNGSAEVAYNLLEPLEFIHAGEARFDYLIGIAALDSGKPDKATLAFERALAVNPDFSAARLDMARAYYQLGDMLRAKTEFTAVLKQNPSEAARLTIQKYLDAIAEEEGVKLTHVTGYVEGTIGHDSNVNYSTSQSQIFVDYFAAVYPLDSTSVKVSDNYYGIAAGVEVAHRLSTKWRLYAGADLRQRGNRTQKDFDSLSLDVRTGVILGANTDNIRLGISGGQYLLDNSKNSGTAGLNVEWSHAFNPSNQLRVFGRYAQYRYSDTLMEPNNFDQKVIGVGLRRVMSNGKSSLLGSLYHGTENDVSTIVTAATPDGGRADGAKRFSGMRIGSQTTFGEKTTVFINAGVQAGDYGKINSLFLRQRSDRLYDLVAGVNWQLGKLWKLRPQINYSKNASNIAIYEYDRTDVSITVHRDLQ
jgi:outer membrane protein